MLTAIAHSLSNVLVLVLIVVIGGCVAARYHPSDSARDLISRIVNLSIPFLLFHSITSKFSHELLLELLRGAILPFLVLGLHLAIAFALAYSRWVAPSRRGVFITAFSTSTCMFMGIPVTVALFGEQGVPYLLVYFFANALLVWTVCVYSIELDGVRNNGGERPSLLSLNGLRMLFSLPLIGFLLGLSFIFAGLDVPRFVATTTRIFGQMATPLALIFIGMTIYRVGPISLRKVPLELWLILIGGFLIRPTLMFFLSIPFDLEPIMRKVFIMASCLPVTPVTASLAKTYGADDAFASEAVGASTITMALYIPALCVFLYFL